MPAPATVRLLGDAPIYAGAVQQELVTPTGALIVSSYADSFGPVPAMSIERVGYGAGDRDDPSHAERACACSSAEAADVGAAGRARRRSIECEIDDMNPQIFGVVMDRLYAAGALEVFYVPVQMKKNRPGTLLTVVVRRISAAAIADIVFRETTTIGLRYYEVDRECLTASIVTVETPIGAIRFKVASRDGRVRQRRTGIRRLRRGWRPPTTCPSRTCRRWPSTPTAPLARPGISQGDIVSRFFLTTAIDYVNSRPHLGTAYEKICADVIARYKRLCGFDTYFLMGNDEHSQNVFRNATEAGARSARVLRSDGAGVPRTWRTLDLSFDDFIRTTEPRHKAGVTDLAHADLRRRRHLRRRLRRLVLRRLRGVQAGEGSRRRQVSAAPDDHAAVDQGEELLLPALQVPAAAARSLRRAPGVPAARHRGATRSCGCSKAASRTSRSAAPGSRGAFRCRSIPRASSTSGSMR